VKRLLIALGLLLAVALACIVAGGAALLLRGGISAKAEPTRLEAAIARRLLRMGIPEEYKQLRNPVASQASGAGRAHFADHCAVCHGNDGSGQTEMGRKLYPRSPDLRRSETQQLSDGELFYIIDNGVRMTGMPGWGDGSEQSKQETWHLVAFIRHLPRLTREEKLEMERMNPKSMAKWREMQEDDEFLEGADKPARTK
jgi:mono/diheme cytochrome c family protein